jgi:hypothetical protein
MKRSSEQETPVAKLQDQRLSAGSPEKSSGYETMADLVSDRLTAMVISRRHLVQRWGYQNESKGLRRLEQLEDGTFVPDATSRQALISSLGIAEDVFLDTLAAMQLAKDKAADEAAIREWLQWGKHFRPHAIWRTERDSPSQIFIVAFIGVDKILRLDLDQSVSQSRWVKTVRSQMPDQVISFGKVTGFYINYAPDHAKEFDRLGNVVGELSKAVRPGRARLRFKGREISPLLASGTDCI